MPVAADVLHAALDRLADVHSTPGGMVSMYLNLKSDQASQQHMAFLDAVAREHEDSKIAFDRIRAFLEAEKPDAQAIAIFCETGEGGHFESVLLDAPLDAHRLYIDDEPHVFPLERLADQYRSYAALLLNTNSARLYVFSAGAAEREVRVRNKKGKRVSAGGWSQARYQRRAENLHAKHMKEVGEAVEQLVREEDITLVLVAADDVALPLLREHLSPATAALLTPVDGVDIKTGDAEVFQATLEAFRQADEQTDQERVDALLNAYRARGLATVGVAGVRAALERGQVDSLLVPAMPAASAADEASAGADQGGTKEQRGHLDENVIEELLTMARRTDAAIAFIEDAGLLEPAGGVAATLRYRV